MTAWPISTLGQVATLNRLSLSRDWPYKYLKYLDISSIGEGMITSAPLSFALSEAPSRARRLLAKNDTVLSIVRPNRRAMFFASNPDPDLVVSTGFCVITPNASKTDPRFLFYCVFSKEFTDYLVSREKGAAYPAVTSDDVSLAPIPLPPLETQRAIAAILGSLDDKIESNRRAIDLLEALVQTRFVEWRGQTSSPTRLTFGSFAQVYGGATPRTTEPRYWGGGLAWTTPTDVTRLASPYLFSTSRTISEAGLNSCTTVMHPVGSIFMTSRATIGAFAVNQIPATTNQGFIVVRPRRNAEKWFLFEEMRSRVQEFLDNANGSTFPEISRGRFKELPLDVPETEAIDELDLLLGPLHTKAAQLAEESKFLEILRDVLLPELLSGRIRVTEARKEIQGVVT